ncbi:hypothetical protein TNCV_2797901 [Trichonephila clavipes]|nr:hypothetical protein TNCV_2797901 [Trichonephila clavipes]
MQTSQDRSRRDFLGIASVALRKYLLILTKSFLDSSTALRLSDWSSSNDETSVSNLFELRKISQMHDVHIQWISSHVNNRGNEVTDRLTKVGSENEAATGNSFTYQERTKMEDPNKI